MRAAITHAKNACITAQSLVLLLRKVNSQNEASILSVENEKMIFENSNHDCEAPLEDVCELPLSPSVAVSDKQHEIAKDSFADSIQAMPMLNYGVVVEMKRDSISFYSKAQSRKRSNAQI